MQKKIPFYAKDCDATCPIVGESPQIRTMLHQLNTFAQSDAPLLIVGESGTGKELAAQLLHQRGPRHNKPFVVVNCAALPEPLLEAELFGHEKGAFTGAVQKRTGRFKFADAGTILLDEVAEMPPTSQAKLLRVLQEGEFQPLGSNHNVRVNVRIISATHQNLSERVRQGLFREDLYYRLRVLDLAIPPLRQRMADLPVLVSYFLRKYAAENPVKIAPAAWAKLVAYAYPGNVRELAHVIERAVILAQGDEIEVEHLPIEIVGPTCSSVRPTRFQSLHAAMWQFEEQYLREALEEAQGKKVLAARLLGISRKNLWQKLHSHGLDLIDEGAETQTAPEAASIVEQSALLLPR